MVSLAKAFRTPQARILVSLGLLAPVPRAPFEVSNDTWFHLVVGREITTTGLVTHNNFTQQGFGAECVDQQWLAHLTYYAIATQFGLVGVVVLASIATFVAFGAFALVVAALAPRWADAALGRFLRVESDRILRSVSRILIPISLMHVGCAFARHVTGPSPRA